MINQQQFGTPAGNPNILAPVQGAISDYFGKKRRDAGDLRRMVVGHELQSMRDERKFGHERGMLEAKQGHELTLQERGMKHARSQGRAQRKHELESKRLDIAGHVLKQNTAFEGVAKLGKGKRVSSFEATADGGMKVSYNKPTRRRSSTTPGQPTQVAPTTPQRSTETPVTPTPTSPFVPKMRQNPSTKKFERNPDHPDYKTTSTPAAKTTPKAARKPRSK